MKAKLFLLAMVTMVLAGCTDDLERRSSYTPEGGLQATIPAYPFDDGTRVSISDDLQTFTWSDGDQIGIYYLDGDITAHAGFGILTGGGTTGTFTNSAFSLHPSSTYYGFYPFNENATVSEAPVDFTGQAQTRNGRAAHLGAMNYMYSVVNTDEEGNAQINFHNLGSVMVIKMVAPETKTYSSLEIYSDNAVFTTKGTVSMTDGTVTPTETSNSISLSLGIIGEGLSVTRRDLLTFYLLTAPVDLSESTLYFTLHQKNETGSAISVAHRTGKDMKAGKAYLYDFTNREAPYVTFGGSGEQTLQLSKEVPSLEYSVNGGAWTTLGTNTVTFGGTNGNLRLRGKSSVGTNGATITFGNSTPVGCSGDIRTLVDYENYDTANTSEAKFKELFKDCTQLTTAPRLPATTLADYCYESMFRGCTSLTQAPKLPATTLAYAAYHCMFQNCSSLTTAPELPATNLESAVYQSMFGGCTSLTTAPELPATTLASSCYGDMFAGCISLTRAPELPARTLAPACYISMFAGCQNLNYIKMMATDISAIMCLTSWVSNVSSTGTFVKNAAATWNVTGVNGIPEGWTVQTASE